MSKTKLNKSKKLNATARFVIVVAIIAVVFLILTIVSSCLSVTRAENSIKQLQSLEKITYTQDVKQLIDDAQRSYDEIGINGLADSENFAKVFLKNANAEELLSVIIEAKKEYVRLAIKAAQTAHTRKYADGNTDEEIIELISQARAVADEYFKDNYELIDTYSILVELEEKYDAPIQTPSTDESSDDSSASDEADEDIELC